MARKNNITLFGSFFLICLFFIVSCTKDNSATSGSSGGSSFTATVDGVDWKADSIWAYLLQDTIRHFKTLSITGYGSKKELTVIITDSASTGVDSAVTLTTYLAGTSNWRSNSGFVYAADPVNVGSSDTVWSKYGIAYTGQVVVTADDAAGKKVSGNFQFDARAIILDSTGIKTDTVKVTNGLFNNILYQYRH